jgi:hypothetical protein
MLLFKLDIRDFKGVILSNELRHLVLQGIDHRVVELLLALELLNQVLIHLSEIALIAAGALGLTHVSLGLFLQIDTTSIQLHPLSDQAVPNECLGARFLHFLLDKEVEGVGLFIDKLLF